MTSTTPEKTPRASAGPRKLLRYVRNHIPSLVIALVLAGIVGVLQAVAPFLIGVVLQVMFTGESAGGVLPAPAASVLTVPLLGWQLQLPEASGAFYLALLVAVTIVRAAAEYGGVAVTAYLGQSVVRRLRNDVFDRILHQPLQFFQRNATGELISRVSADIERVQTAASETLADGLKQGAIMLFLSAAIILIDWKLALAAMTLIPLAFYPTVWFGRRLRSLGRAGQEELAGMANALSEAFSGNRIVKAFLMEDVENRRFRDVTHRLFRINLRQRMTHALSSPLMEILGVIVAAGFLLYAQSRFLAGGMNVALFVTFVIALIRLYDPVRRISGIHNSFQQAFGASERIFEILELGVEPDSGAAEAAGFSGAITFEDVEFGYDAEAPVLRRVSFEVRRGEVVAIVGASGAGKTTLVNLLPRFYDVTSGRIRIDGIDIREFTLRSLRKQIAMVTQDVILFDDSIRANIAYGDPEASAEDVLRAARAALVDDFVAALPQRYETRIGERGLRLSGGERQRLSIARALLKNAPILILDEATSALDAEAEVHVQSALQNLMQGRTTIVIAHRLSTVRNADRIIALADGAVQESGRHEELLARKGVYRRLYDLQFSAQEARGGT